MEIIFAAQRLVKRRCGAERRAATVARCETAAGREANGLPASTRILGAGKAQREDFGLEALMFPESALKMRKFLQCFQS